MNKNFKKLNNIIKKTTHDFKDLKYLAKELNFKLNIFDIFEITNKGNGCYILLIIPNPMSSSGHYTAFYKYNDVLFYYDSFGVTVPNAVLNKFPEIKYVYYNAEQNQKLNENNCGIFSILFLNQMNDARNNLKDKKAAFIRFIGLFADHYTGLK